MDATDAGAVAALRRRKARDDKPFALMVPDLAMPAGSSSSTRRRGAAGLAPAPDRAGAAPAGGRWPPGVAPGLPELGVMLPYTPLHHLLMAAAGPALVLTSGNLSDEPIAYTDDDAVDRLGPLVDGDR